MGGQTPWHGEDGIRYNRIRMGSSPPATSPCGARIVKRKAMAAGTALLLVGLAAGWYYWPFNNSGILRFPGIVEIQEVRLGSKIGGRVARVLIVEGDQVSPGQDLVVFEIPELENQKAQLQAMLDAVRADALKAENGPR